ncbi:MAG: hypothetical protein MPJ24_06940 [Pirellulaceae bacterium]|nr:hypothetical protein [Pirellulaceae bacterium]
MAKAIFFDLAWQHELYLACGIKAYYNSGKLSEKEYITWKHIDGYAEGGATVSQAGKTAYRTDTGASRMADHEQNVILSPYYKEFHDRDDSWFMDINLTLSMVAAVGIPGVPTFAESNPDGDVTIDADRWTWIRDHVLPAWTDLSPKERKDSCDRDLGILQDNIRYVQGRIN